MILRRALDVGEGSGPIGQWGGQHDQQPQGHNGRFGAPQGREARWMGARQP